MDLINDASELVRRIRVLAFGGNADAELAGKLQTIPGSDADLLTEGAELMFAYRDKLDEDGLALLGQLYTHANDQNWTTFNGGPRGSGNRSEQIVALVRRDLGETTGGVANDTDAWPAPQVRRRDGFDWRQPAAEPATPVPSPAP